MTRNVHMRRCVNKGLAVFNFHASEGSRNVSSSLQAKRRMVFCDGSDENKRE